MSGAPLPFFPEKSINDWQILTHFLLRVLGLPRGTVATVTSSQHHEYSDTYLCHIFSVSSSKLLEEEKEGWLFSVTADTAWCSCSW